MANRIEAVLDSRARRAAKRVGLAAVKSRRAQGPNNRGGYMLVEPKRNLCTIGRNFELSAEEVIRWCTEDDR